MRTSRFIAAALTSVVLAAGLATPSNAADSQSPDSQTGSLEEYLETLSADERATFEATMIPRTTTSSLTVVPADARAAMSARMGLTPNTAMSPNATGCWTARATGKGKGGLGNVLFTYYSTVGWCANQSKVYGAYLAAAGGETSTPGWRYDGIKASGAGQIGNEARAWSKHRFIYRVGFWDTQTADECIRAIGTSAGGIQAVPFCGIM